MTPVHSHINGRTNHGDKLSEIVGMLKEWTTPAGVIAIVLFIVWLANMHFTVGNNTNAIEAIKMEIKARPTVSLVSDDPTTNRSE